MSTKYFWPIALTVTLALEETLRTGAIPTEWIPYVTPAVTFLAFLVRSHKP